MTISYNYTGRTVFVTGGGSGIGKAIAAAFSRAGANVIIANRNKTTAEAAAREFESPTIGITVDVSKRDSVEAGVTRAIKQFGGIDILVASAGTSSFTRAMELTDSDWDETFATNTRGIFLTNQIVARHFIETQRNGSIINIASIAGKVGMEFQGHYSASKFAVLGWTQTLARELGKYGIRINALCPGYVSTPMQEREVKWESELRSLDTANVIHNYIKQTSLNRLEQPQDIAGLALYIASDGARFITGQSINVDGGVIFN